MKIKDLISKYWYTPKCWFINISKSGEENINKQTFDFIKEAQDILSDKHYQEQFYLQERIYRNNWEKITTETGILKQTRRLQERYQQTLLNNNLFFN